MFKGGEEEGREEVNEYVGVVYTPIYNDENAFKREALLFSRIAAPFLNSTARGKYEWLMNEGFYLNQAILIIKV